MNFLATSVRRKILFTILYASEGAPIGFIWWALPTYLRSKGVAVDHLTIVASVAALPWALKFLWSPLIDVVQTGRWSLRNWIIAAQAAMGCTLIPLLGGIESLSLAMLTGLVALHAISAATQDAAIDALCIKTVPEEERGSLNGWMQAGMLAGRSLFGGGALLMAEIVGFDVVVATMIFLIWASLAVVFMTNVPESLSVRSSVTASEWKTFFIKLASVFRSKKMITAAFIALVGGAGFEAVGIAVGPMMIDHGLTTSEAGFFFSVVGVCCMIIGALVGGHIADRAGAARALLVFQALLTTSVAVFALTVVVTEKLTLVEFYVFLGLVYFCIGLFTASSYALFMAISDKQLGATQFSALMGLTNVCESWSGYSIGRLHGVVGYGGGFLILAGISLLSIPPIVYLMRSRARSN